MELNPREQSYYQSGGSGSSKMEEVKIGGATNIGSSAESSLLSGVASSIKEATGGGESAKR